MATPVRRARPSQAESDPARRSGTVAGSPEADASDPHHAEPDILSVDEIVERHEGEWVLVRVTALNGGWPTRGELLAHGPSRAPIDEVYLRLIKHPTVPGVKYQVFQAYRYIRTGAEMRAALEAAWESGAEGAWRRW